MNFSIDASDIIGFGSAMAAGGNVLHNELATTNQAIVASGIQIAQGNAPVMDGTLKNSINLVGQVTADGGSFGTSLIYAWQREEGGPIYGNPWLVFKTRDGQWIKTRRVLQTGSHYMRRTIADLAPMALIAWRRAIDRAWERMT